MSKPNLVYFASIRAKLSKGYKTAQEEVVVMQEFAKRINGDTNRRVLGRRIRTFGYNGETSSKVFLGTFYEVLIPIVSAEHFIVCKDFDYNPRTRGLTKSQREAYKTIR